METMIVIENGIIPIYKDNEKNIVDARELHAFLGVGKDFTSWIKDRIVKYEFVENTDFVATPQKRGVANGGFKTVVEYMLTVDTAKQIAMVQNNDKGKEARKYFIETEKKFKSLIVKVDSYLIGDPISRAKRWIEEHEEKNKIEESRLQVIADNKVLANRIIEDKPKVDVHDRLIAKGHVSTFRETANAIGIKQKTFNTWLEDKKYIYRKRNKKREMRAHSEYIGTLFEQKCFDSTNSDYSGMMTMITVVGYDRFVKELKQEGLI